MFYDIELELVIAEYSGIGIYTIVSLVLQVSVFSLVNMHCFSGVASKSQFTNESGPEDFDILMLYIHGWACIRALVTD